MSFLLDASVQARPICILLVEDEPGDRELLEIALRRNEARCQMHTVEDGIEAMKYLRQIDPYTDAPRPDLLILDLNLPRKDGREVLRELKAEENLRDIPVIVLSTSYDDSDVSGAYRLGASSYIVKPGNFREFNAIVEALKDYWFAAVTLPRRR